jgi:apolipoprotein D and lipocalin family protein
MRHIFYFFVLFLGACSNATPSHLPLERAPFVDVTRLKGDWNVVAHIPTSLDKDGADMRARFEMNPDQTLNLKWTFKKSAASETETNWNLHLYPGQGTETTIWFISPLWPIKFTFQVTEFSADYSWLVLASADRKNLWILSREKNIDPLLMEGLFKRLENTEFDVAAIVKQQTKSIK